MNPYLEQDEVWHDFHERFIPHVAEALLPLVRPHYIVKLDEHVYIHELPGEGRRLAGRGDVNIARPPGGSASMSAAVGTLAAPAYAQIPGSVDTESLSFIEVRDRQSREVVTVIELLSPANKHPGPDREQYLSKRRRLFGANCNLVELDLLRGQPRLPLVGFPPCDYYALVSRPEDRPSVAVWPIGLRERLPAVPIPLRAPHANVVLDLQAILHRVYDAAGYEDYIYDGSPQPALSPEDATWAARFVPEGRV